MKPHSVRNYALLAGVAFFALLGVPVLSWWAIASPGDLELLRPYAEKYNYDGLIETLEARGPAPETFSFAVFGDTRNVVFVASKIYEKTAELDPVMAFHTGDLIRGGTVDEYLEFYLPLLEITDPIPVFPVPGNHERGARRDFAAYHAIWGSDRFSFDYGPCRFVGFNASEVVRVTRSELRFLDRELSKPGAEYKFVFFHIPPKYFEKAIIGDDSRGFAWNSRKLHEIFVRNGVTEVFMGHIHGYASTKIDGVRYTLTAGAGAPLSTRLPEEGQIYHLLMMEVSPEGLSQELYHLVPGSLEWERRTVY